MNPRLALTLLRSALRAVRYVLRGRIGFPQDRLGFVLEHPDGDTFFVYRETALRPMPAEPHVDGAVLVFRMHVTEPAAKTRLRDVLFDPLTNVATPFFAGMPGFRRKLWLAGERQGEFLELYEWDSTADANRFVEVLDALLAPFDFAGSAEYEVAGADSIDEYVATQSVAWRDTAQRSVPPDGINGLRVAGLVLIVSLAVYLVWNRFARSTVQE